MTQICKVIASYSTTKNISGTTKIYHTTMNISYNYEYIIQLKKIPRFSNDHDR